VTQAAVHYLGQHSRVVDAGYRFDFEAAVLGGIGVVVSKNHHRTGSFLAGEVRDVISFDAA